MRNQGMTLPTFVRENYEAHEWRHAIAILQQDFSSEYNELLDVLTRLRLRRSWIVVGGGSKSELAKWLDSE
jgi:hypothetical protein